MATGTQQPVDPRPRAAHLAAGEQRRAAARPADRRDRRRSGAQHLDALVGQRLAAPLPQQRAQLVLDVRSRRRGRRRRRARRASGSRCPPLRSALLITASNTACGAGPASVAARHEHATRSTVSSTSIQSWHHARSERPVAEHGRAARCPTRSPRTPRRPRPRARPACRRGSPTAAAPPRPACRRTPPSTPSRRDRAVERRVARRRRSRPSTSSSPVARAGAAPRRRRRAP